jgi:hypothetical protein
MTTHFSNGVTNVRGKDGDTSLFSGIKQPLITGGYGQEVAYQNDWVIYNSGDWDVTSGGGSDFQLVDYAGGWLRLGDDAPAGGEITGISGKEIWNYNSGKQWWYETRIAVTDVTELNFFVGFADNAFVDPATVPTDCIGFSHLEDTTSIQFLSRKNAAGTSFDMTDTAGGSTFAMLDSTVPTQTATQFFAGDPSPAACEQFNGTTFVTDASLANGRSSNSGAGVSTLSLCFGSTANAEEYTGETESVKSFDVS